MLRGRRAEALHPFKFEAHASGEMIMSRILMCAALALAALGTSVQSQAAEYGYHHRRAHHNGYAYAPRSYGFFSFGSPYGYYNGPVGGHKYAGQHNPFNFTGAVSYNYPGFYNNTTFWERVQTQRNYPVQY